MGAGVLPGDRGRYFQPRVVAPDIADVRQFVLELRATGVVQGTRTMLALETLFEKSALGYPSAAGMITGRCSLSSARSTGSREPV